MKALTLIFIGLAVFTLCTASLLAAESNGMKRSYWGLVGGVNLGQFIGDNSDALEFYGGGEKKFRFGVAIGVFAHLGIGNNFAIEPQVLYSQKGAKYGDLAPSWDDQLVLKLDYVEAPLFFRVYVYSSQSIKVNIFGGGYFGYLVRSKYKYSEVGYEEEGDLEDILVVPMEEIDYGPVFGAGMAFPAQAVIYRLDVKYSLGLAKLFYIPPDDDIRNGVISILFSIGF